MSDNVILLVEDSPNNEALTLSALKKNNIFNEMIVVCDTRTPANFNEAPVTRGGNRV